ncbi:MAG: serine hydrolase domain-containing protein [Planctomycetota bacterium]|jgi:CubicO group peptidase (beta-lactamase class C family)
MQARCPPTVSILAAVMVACCGAGCRQPGRPANAPVGSSHPPEHRVDELFSEFDRADGPGCAVAVYRGGEVILSRAYGVADLEQGTPVTRSTVFDIASNSKQFMGFAILLLEARGQLSLTDDVRTYVPEVPESDRPIRVHQLLHNTSGLRDIGELRELAGLSVETHLDRSEFLEILRRQHTLNFSPGEDYAYSNTNWIILALILERVDGRSFGAFLQDEVFEPLGMHDTFVRDGPAPVVPHLTRYYTPLDDGTYRQNHAWQRTSGIGGMSFVHSTADDLARWDANFSHATVGGRDVVERMYRTGRLASGAPITYAAGLIVSEYRGLPVIYHGGLGGGVSQLVRFPDQNLSVFVASNQYHTHADAHALCFEVADLYLDGPLGARTAPPVHLAKEDLARYGGEYWIESQVRYTCFVPRDGMLWEMDGETGYPMQPIGDGRFQDEYETITFAPDALTGGGISRLSRIEYQLERRVGWHPTDTDMEAYSGTYESRELDHAWRIDVSNEALVLRRRGQGDVALEPGQPGCFVGPGLRLRFERSGAGEGTRILVSTERIMDLEFIRRRDD